MVEEELARFSPEKETALTIGVFDGVHLGHQHLIGYLTSQAQQKDLISGVITFRCHPQHVLSPQTRLPYLTSLTERVNLLQGVGVELVIPLSFTLELARVSADEFVAWLRKHLKMRVLIVGPDFALGRGREGDVFRLQSLGQEMGFSVVLVPPMVQGGEVISSTAIRQALLQGDASKAKRLLGRPFSLSGEVVHGKARGRSLGFPTANLAVDSNQLVPADGVYVTKAYIGGEVFPSVTNIGRRPTFGGQERAIEVYLLEFKADLYKQELKIEFLERLRGEKQFTSAEELAAQIRKDVEQAEVILGAGR